MWDEFLKDLEQWMEMEKKGQSMIFKNDTKNSYLNICYYNYYIKPTSQK